VKDLSITKAEWESSRIDFILELEKLEPYDIESYVRDFLLPNLQQSYNHAKEFISNNTKRNIYTVKKHLADLIENDEVVRISNTEDYEISDLSRYGAAYLIVESLNNIYLFSSIMKTKLPPSEDNAKLLFTLGKLSKEICPLAKEIKESIEQQIRSSLRI